VGQDCILRGGLQPPLLLYMIGVAGNLALAGIPATVSPFWVALGVPIAVEQFGDRQRNPQNCGGGRSQPPNCGMAYGVTGRANDRILAPDAIATNWRPFTM
jgi:hypothetical protein